MSNRFAHCHRSGDVVWCMHHNGAWAPPFPADDFQFPVVAQASETETNKDVSSEENDVLVSNS